jgi:hypothetical protein
MPAPVHVTFGVFSSASVSPMTTVYTHGPWCVIGIGAGVRRRRGPACSRVAAARWACALDAASLAASAAWHAVAALIAATLALIATALHRFALPIVCLLRFVGG